MRRWNANVQRRVSHGSPITVGDVTITPRSTALVVRLGGGAFVWNRPTGVDIERDGVRQQLPIIDWTWLAWLGLRGLLVLVVLLGVWASLPRKERAR